MSETERERCRAVERGMAWRQRTRQPVLGWDGGRAADEERREAGASRTIGRRHALAEESSEGQSMSRGWWKLMD